MCLACFVCLVSRCCALTRLHAGVLCANHYDDLVCDTDSASRGKMPEPLAGFGDDEDQGHTPSQDQGPRRQRSATMDMGVDLGGGRTIKALDIEAAGADKDANKGSGKQKDSKAKPSGATSYDGDGYNEDESDSDSDYEEPDEDLMKKALAASKASSSASKGSLPPEPVDEEYELPDSMLPGNTPVR